MIRRKLVCPPKSSFPVGPKFYRPVFDSLLYALPADALNLCFLFYLDCLISVILDNWLTTGYVQGMSDLLSVVYAIMQDDSDAFWCFCGFMDRMVSDFLYKLTKKYNFLLDQTGMRRQLVTLKQLTQLMIPKLYAHLEKSGSDEFFFLFRQLLVWFKREFSWEDVCTLWEVLWTDYLSGQFHLFVALAILDKHKEVIIGNNLEGWTNDRTFAGI